MVEEDIKKTCNRMQGIGGLEEESGERIGQAPLVGKIHQDNKLMMMMMMKLHT